MSADRVRLAKDEGTTERLPPPSESSPGEAKKPDSSGKPTEDDFARAVFEDSVDAIYAAGVDGRICACNPAACETLGYSRRALCSLSVADIDIGLPVGAWEDLWRDLQKRRVAVRETVHRARSGHTFPVELAISTATCGGRRCLLIVARDMSARTKAEAALSESHAVLESIVENIPDMVVLKDAEDLRVVRLNRAAESFLGRPRHDVIGRTGEMLFRPEQGDAHDPIDEQALAAGGAAFEEKVQTPHNARRFLESKRIAIPDPSGRPQFLLRISRDVTDERHVRTQLKLQSAALECAANAIMMTDREGVTIWANQAAASLTGYPLGELVGQHTRVLRSGVHDKAFYENLWAVIRSGDVWTGELVNRKKDGTHYSERMTITPILNGQGDVTNFIAIKEDITARRLLEAQLVQAQKLESIGQLAAGIAHEINTPTQYIGDNTRFLQDAFSDLEDVFRGLRTLASGAAADSALDESMSQALQKADLDYLLEEIPAAIRQSLEGVDRVAGIVAAMREFSHPGNVNTQDTDINRAIESTITVSRNAWKYVAVVDTILDRDLPAVPCLPGEFNQAILNLIVNAAHAIEERFGQQSPPAGKITIKTRLVGEFLEVTLADNGTGIPLHVRDKIFDPFFTTKEVGRGTGQGLALARAAIVEKLGGELSVRTELGEGTEFAIRLPRSGVATSKEATG